MEKIKQVENMRGIVRELDIHGRIVIPMEIRKSLDIEVGDRIEIFAWKDGTLI